MFTECKKYFVNNEAIYNFILKSETAYQSNDYPSSITFMNHACRVFMEQRSDYQSPEFIALNGCGESIKTELAQSKQKIAQLEALIAKLNLSEYTCFKCLENTSDYFNQFGLCGVVVEDEKWVWCHQGFVSSGDNPNIEFYRKAFDSLGELVDTITDELLRKYKQTPLDKAFARLSEVIVGAYNGSYKPPLVNFAKGLQCEYTKHTPIGYCFVFSDMERGCFSYIKLMDEKLPDYISHIFLVDGNVSVNWNDIISSKAVEKALEKEYGSGSFVVRYYEYHKKFGECLVCSELIGETWRDGYYTFDEAGMLIKKGEAR